MQFENPFLEQYKKLSNAELLEIIARKEDYQPLAVDAANAEISLRGLSVAELDAAKQEVEAKRSVLLKQEERRQEKIDKVKSFGNFLYETFYPVQFNEKRAETYIKYICFSLTVILLLGLYGGLKLLYWPLGINRPRFEDLVFFLPHFYISATIILFWQKKRSGWVLLFFYVVFSMCMEAHLIMNQLKYGSDPIFGFIKRPSIDEYLFMLLFDVALLLLLFRKGIREIYEIKLPEKAKDFDEADGPV